MEFTTQERERLQIQWKNYADICRRERRREREETLLYTKQIFLSVFFTLLVIFSFSGLIVAWILPFKR